MLVVDETAMLDARNTGELLAAARQAGAKVILAGDDRQLASIERGGLFTELRQRHGAAEISAVTRQRADSQRQAARDLSEGRFAQAVAAFDTAGAITWTPGQEAARNALVAAWTQDTGAQPGARQFVFAYTNRDVDALNAQLRQVRRRRGELGSPDVRFMTKHSEADFAIGDRVQFTDSDKRLHIHNGNAGAITAIHARTGQLTATLDSGRAVSWSADAFLGFRHGYAGTIYRGQGKTLDDTYLYHTEHWRSAAAYVALTRQCESAQVFVARDTAGDAAQLAQQIARGDVKAASMAWATREEMTEHQTGRAATSRQSAEDQERRPRKADRPRTKVRSTPEAQPDARLVKHIGPAAAKAVTAVSGRTANASARLKALRRELRALDHAALAETARADRVGLPWGEPTMILADAARLVSLDFAVAADRATQLRNEAANIGKAIEHYEGVLRAGQEQGGARWRELGFLGQVMHKTGVRRDRWLGLRENAEHMALELLAGLDPRSAELAKHVAKAEKAEAAAFEQAEPVSAAELAHRQNRASVAREIMSERNQQEIARQLQRERSRSSGRDHGIGR